VPRKPKLEKHKGVYEKVKGSKVWWIRYINADKKRVAISVGTYEAAVKLYETRKMELRAGIISPPTVRRGAKFSELVADAIQFYKDTEKSDVLNLTQRTRQTLPEFGDRIAETITGKELQAWMDKTAAERKWSGGTRNAIRASLGTVFREGMRSEKVSSNPVKLTRRAKESVGRLRFVYEEEEARMRPHFHPYGAWQYDVAVHTGMRRSEQFTVTMDQVNFDEKNIFLTKTKNGRERYVRLNSTALKAFEEIREEHRRLNLPPDALAFLSQDGGEIQNPRKWFATACKKAGVQGVTWHILRHTHASRLTMAGVHSKVVQDSMGHLTPGMTNRYQHLSPGHVTDALELLVSKGTIREPIAPASGS
jgi:integrase